MEKKDSFLSVKVCAENYKPTWLLPVNDSVTVQEHEG